MRDETVKVCAGCHGGEAKRRRGGALAFFLGVLGPVLGIAGSGCGGGDGESTDGGAGHPYPFEAPAFPRLAPCSGGFREVPAGQATACDPWPEGGPTDCPAGHAHFPGGAGCERVGTECPLSGEPTDLPEGVPLFHVRAGAAGGDGSRAAPFGDIQRAIDAATLAGTVVAVGPGTYEETLEIPGGVTVWGACAAETLVRGLYPLTVLAAGNGAALRNVTVTGEVPGIWVQTTSIDVRDVIVDGAALVGVFVQEGGQATLDHVVVRNTQPDPTSAVSGGIGVSVELGGAVELRNVLVTAAHATGVIASGAGVTLAARDLTIIDTRSSLEGTFGRGLDVKNGAQATIERLVVQGNRAGGLFLADAGTRATLSDVVVTDTLPEEIAGNGSGRGINVQDGAWLQIDRALLARNREGGLVVLGGTVEARDLVVAETEPRSDGTYGRGIGVDGAGSSITLERALVEANHDIGVFVNGDGAALTGSDLVIRGTRAQPADSAGGRGLVVQGGARAEIARAHILSHREAGVLATGGGLVTLSDLAVVDTEEAACVATTCPEFGLGDGVMVAYGSRGTIERFVITESDRAGVTVGPEAEIDLSDGEVADNLLGASIQAAGFDVARIQTGVVYRDNGRNLDRGALPLAAPSLPF